MRIASSIIPRLFLILLLTALAYGYIFLKNPANFPIKRVQIEATYKHINPRTLQQAAAPYIKGSFFTLNVYKITNYILQLPWVYAVDIKRSWPDGVVISVTEQTPVARWNGNSLLNSDADMFTPDKSTIPDNLPLLSGPDDQAAEVLEHYQVMNQALAAIDLKIAQVNLDAQGSWHILLHNGITILLRNSNIIKRFQEFIKVYPRIIGAKGKKVVRVDLRYNNGFAIKWKKI
jgi:cell division protein FtsQ